jgi:hypothetical protein
LVGVGDGGSLIATASSDGHRRPHAPSGAGVRRRGLGLARRLAPPCAGQRVGAPSKARRALLVYGSMRGWDFGYATRRSS